MNKKMIQPFILILLISLAAELFLFNRASFFSLTGESAKELAYTVGDGLELRADGFYEITDSGQAYLELDYPESPLKYLYLNIDCRSEDGVPLPMTIRFDIEDEGNCYYYTLPLTTSYPIVESSKYFRIHSYGSVKKIRVYLYIDQTAYICPVRIIANAKVPCFFSLPRTLILFLLISLLYILRPRSQIYHRKWSMGQKRGIVLFILFVNICAWGILTQLNTPFLDPVWPHHSQYHQLAAALTEGRVSIETGLEEALSSLENPYDPICRDKLNMDMSSYWDIAFYQGKTYVYFGIVPVLLFYLPYYLIFHSAFPTWIGIFLTGAALLAGTFYLLKQIIRRWFPDTPFALYLMLALFMGNGIGTIPIMMRPDFYSLPIICAMCFTVWGLAFWIHALISWDSYQEQGIETARSGCKRKTSIIVSLLAGSLCLALTAGCRPQFLLGSFLIFPLFCKTVRKENRLFTRQNMQRLLALAIPYLIVAAGLMYYNYIRFGSVLDFGANYNITTNDMTHRGFHLGRIPDGIFQYLFQLPNIGLKFPFVNIVSESSNYLGLTVREYMFGGIFFIHILLSALIMLGNVKLQLKQKHLYAFSVCCILFGTVIVIADAEMAGLLSRYYADFLWIFFLPAILVILQLWESIQSEKRRKWLILFLLLAGLSGLFMDLGIGIQAGQLASNNVHRYLIIKSFFL